MTIRLRLLELANIQKRSKAESPSDTVIGKRVDDNGCTYVPGSRLLDQRLQCEQLPPLSVQSSMIRTRSEPVIKLVRNPNFMFRPA